MENFKYVFLGRRSKIKKMSKYDEIKINDLHRDQNLAALA